MGTERDRVRVAAYEALKRCLALEDPAFRNGGDDLQALAGRMVEFWRAEASGEILTGNLIDSAIHRARLLCEVYDVDGRGKAAKVKRAIKTFALIGAELFKVFEGDEAGGKEKEQDDVGGAGGHSI